MATTKRVQGCVVIMSLATERGKEGEREEEEEGERVEGGRGRTLGLIAVLLFSL